MKPLALLSGLILLLSACGGKRQVSGTGPWYDSTTIVFTQQIADDSTIAVPYYRRGMALRALREDSLALEDFESALRRDTTRAEYYSAIGDLLFDHKDISASLPYFQRALARNPNDPRTHLKIAKVLLFTKDYGKAFQEINFVLRQNPSDAEAYFLKGMVYKDMQDTNRAISSFHTALGANPTYRDPMLQLGALYLALNDTTGLLYLNNAYNLDSSDVYPLYARGMYYQRNNRWEEAKALYNRAVRLDNGYEDAWFSTGYILLQQDSFRAAIPYFEKAADLNPLNAGAIYNRGLCKELSGDLAAARADYQEVLEVNPGHAAAREGLKRVKP